jgi:hypothetical protein
VRPGLGNNFLFHLVKGRQNHYPVRVLLGRSLLQRALHDLFSSWFLFRFCVHILLFRVESRIEDQFCAAEQKYLAGV